MKRIATLLTVIAIFNISLLSQVISGFTTAEKTSSCPPLLIHFNNLSSGNGTLTYKWNFGNGITSTQQNPSTTYSKPGKYTIQLITTNGIDSDTTSAIDFIEVFTPPTANYAPQDTITICAPNDIQYTNSSTPGSSAIIENKWDFGDGFVNPQTNPRHTYSVAGFYTPSLTVKDANGCLNSTSISNQIKAYKPIASFSSDGRESCEGALNVKYYNLSNGSGKLNCLWDFGDNTNSNATECSHLYDQVGNYTVSLQVSDDFGCSDTITKQNFIKVTAITPSFTFPSDTVCAKSTVQFLNTTTNSSIFNWNFGDGTTSTLQNPKHIYSQPGEYEISLFASNGLCGGTSKKTIVVEYLKAEFLPEVRYGCEIPLNIKYTNTSTNASTYEWRFGNAKTSTLKEPIITYTLDDVLNTNKQRSYKDTLIITSKRGCKSQMVLDSSVVIVLPQANFTPNPFDGGGDLKGCAPLTVNFKDISTYSSKIDQIAKYKWTFLGDNKASRDVREFTEIFTKDTLTEVTLTITTQKGCTAKAAYFVGAGTKQVPDFKLINTTNVICASDWVDFENTSTDMNKITSSTWTWGDGGSSALGDSHLYTKTGSMNVSLEVSSYGCTAKITKNNFVTIKGPIAKMSNTINCQKPNERVFTADITDATSYSWNFGDGTTVNNQQTVAHTFAKTGTYTVKLSAINGICQYSPEYKEVTIKNINLVQNTTSSKACLATPFTFNASKSIDVAPWTYEKNSATYLWDFGDGTKKVFTNDTVVSHSFLKRGAYKITLVSKDVNLCSDTLVINQRIFSPYSNFTSTYSDGCMPITYQFTNTSKADTLSLIQSYKWDFGDGQSSVSANPSHSYTSWGNYNVSLTTTDNQGCSTLLTQNGAITALYPNPKFAANDTTLCIGDSATFASLVPTQITSYLWTFPDGTTSTVTSPKQKFPIDGTFDVSLYIVDKHGCDTLGIQTNYIKVQKPPVVDFIADPLTSNCYPTEVTFADKTTSNYLGGWKWDFGDVNGFSYRQNPQHIYIRPGKFNIKLIAYTTYGCSDSVIKTNYVNPKGPFAEIVTKDTICRDASTTLQMINPFNVYNFKWDLGDGTIKTDTISAHTYTKVGHFYPGLFLVSDTLHTCDKYVIDSIYVSETLAKYKLDNQLPYGCVPYQISYTNLSTGSNQWKWDLGNSTISSDFNPTNNYTTDGTYTGKLSVRNDMGCTDSITLPPITVYPLPTITISPDQFICLNSSTLLEATGGTSYNWTPALGLANANSASTDASPNTTTQYTVLVTDVHGCQKSSSMNLTVQQYPVAQTPDSTIIVGESIQFDVASDAIKSYLWEPNYNISCTTCSTPIVQPLTDTTYKITVQDTANCFIKTYSTHITIEHKYSVDVPTAFTPNGDGINDQVFVKGWGIKELITFRIFNRFGEMIFETKDINQGWNGEGNGTLQSNDTFQFIVKVRAYNDQIITKTGTIKILK